MRQGRRLGVVTLVLAWSLAGVAGPAKACTCPAEDARTELNRAAAAFIGGFVGKEPADPADGEEVEYRFRVDEAVKGDLGATVTIVKQHTGGISCGLGTPGPEQRGWLLQRHADGRWREGGGCAVSMEPDALRAAGRPLPGPDGRGPPTFLLGGSFGDVRTIALDRDGRTLAYGDGAPHTRAIDVCPGSSRAVELSAPYEGSMTLTVRGLPDMGVIRNVSLPGPQFSAVAARCTDAEGTNGYISTVEGQSYEDQKATILRLRGGALTTVWSGAARSAVFNAAADSAYLTRKEGDGTVTEKVDLATARVRRLARVAGEAEAFVPDLSERWLAATVQTNTPGAATAAVVLFDLRRPVVAPRSAALEHTGGSPVLWVGSRLVVTGHGELVRTYDTDLRRLSSWGPWYALSQAVVGDVLYGTSFGELVAAPLSTGPKRVMATRPGLLGMVLEHVPPPPPAPAPTTTTVLQPAPEDTTTVATTTTRRSSSSTTPEIVVAAPASNDRGEPGGGLIGLAVAMWLGTAVGSVLARRRRSGAIS